jgi:hypothetical protein
VNSAPEAFETASAPQTIAQSASHLKQVNAAATSRRQINLGPQGIRGGALNWGAQAISDTFLPPFSPWSRNCSQHWRLRWTLSETNGGKPELNAVEIACSREKIRPRAATVEINSGVNLRLTLYKFSNYTALPERQMT